jgi:tRNA uridine 5-carbamoylmethylation protein Kti12
MPFVMICGLPCSGKTYFVNAFKDYLQANYEFPVIIINDSMFCDDKNKAYSGKFYINLNNVCLRLVNR